MGNPTETLRDPQPEIVVVDGQPLHALMIIHNPDWRGYAEIIWKFKPYDPNANTSQRVSIRAPWLLTGFTQTEWDKPIPLQVLCRAIALASADHAKRTVAETVAGPQIIRRDLGVPLVAL